MVRVLLVLARRSYRARAFLEAARRMQVEVTVASDHRASLGALAPGATLPVRLDDVPTALESVLAFARDRPVHGVMAAEDDGALLAAEVARALGLPGADPEAVRTARDKGRLRAATRDAPWTVPWFRDVGPDVPAEEVAGQVSFPCVVKPVSLSASRGVIRVDGPSQLVRALSRARRILAAAGGTDGRLVVEAFLPGREVALEGLLTGGDLRTLALFDKPDPMDGPFFEETLLVTPSRLPAHVRARTSAVVAEAASAIGLDEGPVHAEVRVGPDGVRLLEIAPRSIGGRCSRVLRFQGGRSLEEVLLAWSVGRPPGCRRAPGAAGVLMLPIPDRGRLVRVDGLDRARAVEGIEDVEITLPRGHEAVPLPEGHQYLGFMFARGPDPGAVERSLRTAQGSLHVVLDARTAGEPDRAGA